MGNATILALQARAAQWRILNAVAMKTIFDVELKHLVKEMQS